MPRDSLDCMESCGSYRNLLVGFHWETALLAEMFPTSVARFFAYMKEHVNTEDE